MSSSGVYVTAGAKLGATAKVRHRSVYGSLQYSNAEASPIDRNRKKMKLTIKQKIRNWLMRDDSETEADIPVPVADSGPNFDADPLRLNVYRAAGGFVVETRKYDRRKDENITSINIITEDKDLGDELSKIVTMETLR